MVEEKKQRPAPSSSSDGDSDEEVGSPPPDEDETSSSQQWWNAAIEELASSAFDAKSPQYRNAQIQKVKNALSESAEYRCLLARLGKDMECTSLHASRRIISLFTVSLLLQAENNDPNNVVADLCYGLCRQITRMIKKSNSDPSLLDGGGPLEAFRRKQSSSSSSYTQQLISIFFDLATSAQNDDDKSVVVVAAVSLGAALDDGGGTTSRDWLSVLLPHTTSQFTDADELTLASSFLQTHVSAEQWENVILPALLLRLKSHPDKTLSTILGWIQNMNKAAAVTVDSDWISLLIKHLTSPKDENRSMVMRIFLAWADKSVESTKQIALALSSTKAALAPARLSLYETLAQLAPILSKTDDMSAVEKIILSIIEMIKKEAKLEQKTCGMEALVEWMAMAKRSKEDKGYVQAIKELIHSPVIAKKPADATLMLSALVQRVHPDLLESIASDVWLSKDKKWAQGLETLLATASTKKSAQLDGLLVVYFGLLYADQASVSIPPFLSNVVAGGASKKSESFLYSPSMVDLISSNDIVNTVIPRVIALYTKLASKNSGEAPLFSKSKVSAASRVLASCAVHPAITQSSNLRGRRSKDQYASNTILSSLDMILTYQPSAAEGLVQALMNQVNESSEQFEKVVQDLSNFRDDRESESNIAAANLRGRGSDSGAHRGFFAHSTRRVARILSKHCQSTSSVARVMIMMHAGSSVKNEGPQRAALILNTMNSIRDILARSSDADALRTVRGDLGKEIIGFFANDPSTQKDGFRPAQALHHSVLSLLMTLGGIACNFSSSTDDRGDPELQPYLFASQLCIEDIAPLLSSEMKTVHKNIEQLSSVDVQIYLGPLGTIFREEVANSNIPSKTGGKKLSEEEEWEIQIKKELAAKKQSVSGPKALSDEDKKLLSEQDAQRHLIAILTEDYCRVLDALRCLCLSDIEVGNECLPIVSQNVLATTVSTSPAFKQIQSLDDKAFETLIALGTCVYEIHEVHAPTIATALRISCRQGEAVVETELSATKEVAGGINVSPLPSPCASAACVIYEIEQFQDTLSGASFLFLFPVIRAALMGPRTATGCDAALKILFRHTELLSEGSWDPIVGGMRKEMVISILELLKHDRAQTFHDPSPFEALVSCYRSHMPDEDSKAGAALSAAELAPLLDERGALGSKNCRIGSMHALERIASDHPKLVKSNPLIENRVWLNCFDADDTVRSAGRKAWITMKGDNVDNAADVAAELPSPSPLYGAPLLPLLSHSGSSIANSAAVAFAHGMAVHPKSVGRNVEIMCTTYIDSFPTSDGSRSGSTQSATAAKTKGVPSLAPPPKKKISTGLPKKKAPPKKSALAVAGIGRPKATKKKTSSAAAAALLKPKQERTLDEATFADQFKSAEVEASKEEKDSPAKVSVRMGVLRAIAALSSPALNVEMDETVLKLLTSFLMAYGIADGEETVKGSARNTLRDVVASNGGSEQAIEFLLPHLEAVLRTGVADERTLGSLPKEKVPKDVSASDRRKEGAVVALGSVALHLKGAENDEKVDNTVNMLIAALNTPSEEVQLSVADALTKLMKKGHVQDRIESILSDLLRNCLYGETLAVRRGSAYGLSAAVKGSGITTLKKYEIIKQLEEACSSGGPSSKEGSLFAIELLSSRLGLLFEPYVIVLLPSLLKAFSDSSDHVRTAANNTASLIMSKLSAHGVKLVMPAVLKAFDDPAWRTKQASIHMLGAMSHLAPKQLASALPKVVPQLTEAFGDTHTKVKASAQEALEEISTVVKNPEISSISSVLLKALTDPADYTVKALGSLIETEFLHAIDAPSLALIVPILHRGLRDRGATTKRFSGLIAGNICTMINDPKDFVPYLPTLLPDLQATLLDPIPDVRSTSAKALGSLTRSLGDHILLQLRPWLVAKLRDETCSSAERSGAAQGLTEVLIASGSNMVEDTMRSEILPLRNYPEASTREGVLWMLTFLPSAMGQGFTSLIDVSLPALISGLSDDSEPVRDVAMRAGRVLIRSHGKVHVDKILPSLEAGLGDDDHRIRVSSLSLLGDLLSTIGGTQVVHGEGNAQDDIRRAERAQAQIALVLGSDTRKRVFSGLYLARSDSVHLVRQSAVQVWKTVVSVTARTLRDILPVLVSRIIDDLASGHEEKTEVAGRCLGDLVSKLGDSVLPQIIPVLRNALYDGDEHTKRGVCVGLTEVIKCSTKDQLLRYIEIIVKVLQDALADDDETVRKMAAASFQSLHAVVGSRAMDEVVPSLMVALESGEEDEDSRLRALKGLTGILSVRSRELLPYVIPRLIQRPITSNRAEVLEGVVRVTGSTIHYHFSSVIPVLLGELAEADEGDVERKEAIQACSRALCGSVDSVGVNWLIGEIASHCGSDKAPLRRESCRMFEYVVSERTGKDDFHEQIPIIIRELVYRLNDDHESVLKVNHAAFSALSKNVPAEELVKHVEFMRNLLASMVSDARRRKGGVGDGEFLMPGFNMPKGLEPLLPIYQRGILYGSSTIREVSASGLGEVIELTSSKYLAGPLIVKMTGPLLRIVGDRNPPSVKVAILKTLGLVLIKGGPALRAFVPQFQTTFVKALSDPARQVRVEAIEALSLLMPLSTRVDPLIKELVAGSLGKNTAVEGLAAAAVQTATLEALATVLAKGGTKAKLPASIPSALDASKQLLMNSDEGIRESAAKVLGASCSLLGSDITHEIISEEILNTEDSEANARHGKACAIRRILASSVGSEIRPETVEGMKKMALSLLDDDKSSVREAGCSALGATIGRSENPKSSLRSSESAFLKIMGDKKESIEIHCAVARALCVALLIVPDTDRVDFMGLKMLDACLEMALKSAQRVQFAFNDVLWLALDVPGGQGGLDRYCDKALFDNQRSMKSLHSKVLTKTKELSILER